MYLSKTVIEKLDKQTLKENLLKLPQIIKKNKWILSYDKDADSLSFCPEKVPTDFVLFNLNRELAIFVNIKSEISGMFIENYSVNFVKHNNGFDELLTFLTKEEDHNGIYVANKEEDLKIYEQALEATLLETMNNKDDLLSLAKNLSL